MKIHHYMFIELLLSASVTFIHALTAREIVEKADRLLRGETSRATVTMTIVRPDWSRQLTMRAWSKGDSLSLILVIAPPRDKGMAFLKLGNEVWNWVPAINRIIKIPPSMMMQSWMGSDFTNDDLVREASVIEDYSHSMLPDTTLDGAPVYRIRMIPEPDAPVVWGEVILWITKDTFIERRAFYYDESGELVNTLVFSEVRTMGGRSIPTKWEMIPAGKPGHKTVIEYATIEFNVPLQDSFFSQQNMKRVR